MTAKPWLVKPLVLPVGDKEYIVEPVEYDTGLMLIAVFNGQSTEITSESPDEDLFRIVMGDAWQQMRDDKCPYPVMLRAGAAASRFQSMLIAGADNDIALAAAEAIWESGIDPELMAALVAAANLSNSKDSKPSTNTASGSRTPRPASTRTTTSRKATPRAAAKKPPAARSAGKTSAGSGR
jgi:hypothetical protein